MPAMIDGAASRWPASESRQERNSRAIVRGGWRALGYGDLADAEGVCEGGQCGWTRAMSRDVSSTGQEEGRSLAAPALRRADAAREVAADAVDAVHLLPGA